MCSTYYLSLPKGTLFAFTINEKATLAHLNGQDVDEARKSLSANLRRLKKDIKYIGYVTKVTLIYLARDSRAQLFHFRLHPTTSSLSSLRRNPTPLRRSSPLNTPLQRVTTPAKASPSTPLRRLTPRAFRGPVPSRTSDLRSLPET